MITAVPPASEAAQARQLTTPEGIALEITLANRSERIAAFLLDFAIIVGLLVGIGILDAYLVTGESELVYVLEQLAMFAILNGYFIVLELRSGGRTPGKRVVGIRVVSRSGGPLRADAVFARNLMRNVEIYIPFVLILHRDAAFPGSPDAAWVLALGWMLVLTLFPAFNRDRLRVGDLVAGTWVVRSPKVSLARDLAKRPTHVFTPAQLEIYGIYELQALEDVLRSGNLDGKSLRKAVAEKIVKKIGIEVGSGLDVDRFLSEFYAALRAHLESRMLFGQRKEKKGQPVTRTPRPPGRSRPSP